MSGLEMRRIRNEYPVSAGGSAGEFAEQKSSKCSIFWFRLMHFSFFFRFLVAFSVIDSGLLSQGSKLFCFAAQDQKAHFLQTMCFYLIFWAAEDNFFGQFLVFLEKRGRGGPRRKGPRRIKTYILLEKCVLLKFLGRGGPRRTTFRHFSRFF